MENTGILLEDRHPGDYVYGGSVSAPNVRTVINWQPYLPDFETQRDNLQDMMCCATMSAHHASLESQINYDIEQGKYRQEALDYFQSAGYMVNGKFKTSVRYSAKMNNTTKDGQYMSVVADGIRHDGILPYVDWPMTDSMTWEEYYSEIPQNLKDKAKLIYQYIDVQYHWVDPYNIPSALLNAPVQIATAVCDGWNTSPLIASCGGACAHCTAIYGEDTFGDYQILDHYNPFLKKLAPNYHIFAAMQYVVVPILPPNVWSKLLSILKGIK